MAGFGVCRYDPRCKVEDVMSSAEIRFYGSSRKWWRVILPKHSRSDIFSARSIFESLADDDQFWSSKHVRRIEKDLYELRLMKGSLNYRLMFFPYYENGNLIIVFKYFHKSTNKSLPREIESTKAARKVWDINGDYDVFQ